MLELIIRGGPLMWPIVACSVIVLGVTMHKWLLIQRAAGQLNVPFEALAGARPRILAPVLDAIEKGRSEEEITLIGSRQLRDLQRGLGVLSLVAVVCPLLGLTGTVTGMIEAFQTIALHPGRVEASLLAGGIWEALLTTAAGLLVAIPSHIAFHVLDGRMEDIAAAMKEVAVVFIKGRPA
jgi:biopolymer transport protein ExbB